MGLTSLFKRLNTNIESLEQELSQAYDKIDMLEGENADMQSQICGLQELVESLLSQQYD